MNYESGVKKIPLSIQKRLFDIIFSLLFLLILLLIFIEHIIIGKIFAPLFYIEKRISTIINFYTKTTAVFFCFYFIYDRIVK